MFEVQNRSLSTIPFVHNILFYYYGKKRCSPLENNQKERFTFKWSKSLLLFVLFQKNTFPLSRKRPENTLKIKLKPSHKYKQILKDLRASPDKVIETGGFSTDQSNALHDELCKMLEANTYILEYGVTQFEWCLLKINDLIYMFNT